MEATSGLTGAIQVQQHDSSNNEQDGDHRGCRELVSEPEDSNAHNGDRADPGPNCIRGAGRESLDRLAEQYENSRVGNECRDGIQRFGETVGEPAACRCYGVRTYRRHQKHPARAHTESAVFSRARCG